MGKMQGTAAAQVRAFLGALAVLAASIAIVMVLSRVDKARDIERTTAEAQAGVERGMVGLAASPGRVRSSR